MHEYALYDASGAPVKRVGVYAGLGVAAALMTPLIHQAVLRVAENSMGRSAVPEFLVHAINSVGALAIFAGLAYVADNVLWKYRAFRGLFAWAGSATSPVLEGRYEGYVTHIDRKSGGEPVVEKWDAKVHIRQTWQQISVAFDFSTPTRVARSHSEMALLKIEPAPDQVKLLHTYRHERVTAGPGDVGVDTSKFWGASELLFVRQAGRWSVRGSYFTDNRATGRIELEQK